MTFALFDPRVRAHTRATYIRSCAVELDCACMDAFYSRRESHCRSTAHNYSYAIHQLVFMVKACVLTARYVYLHAHTDTHDGRARSLRMRRRGARLEQGKK